MAEEAAAVVDPLTRELCPLLVHRLAGATQLLSALRALLGSEPGDAERFLEHAGDLAETAREVDRMGWLLAVLASASGADMLLARREPRGLAIVVERVAERLARQGCALDPSPAAELELAPGALDGWQLPWAVGSLLLASGTGLGEGSVLGWSLGRAGKQWRLRSRASVAVRALAPTLEQRLAGGRLLVGHDDWTLEVPGEWIARRAAERQKQ